MLVGVQQQQPGQHVDTNMPNTFPTSLPSYTGEETLLAAEHAANHNSIMAKIGIDNSPVPSSLDYRIRALEVTPPNLIIGTNVQAWDAALDDFSGLTQAANKLPYFDSSTTMALADFTAAGRALLDDASATAQIATLGLPANIATLALPASTTISTFAATFLDDANAAAVRSTLGISSTGSSTFVATVGMANADYLCDGTDDHVQIQAAIDAVKLAGGGVVFIKTGTYNAATMTLKNTVSLQAESRKTKIVGKNNAAPCLIKSEEFDTYAGSGNAFGGANVMISHGFIDGFAFESGTQTASGYSDFRTANAVIKLYAWDFRISNIRIDYCSEMGLYTEHDNDWNDDGTFNTYEFGENTYHNIKIKNYDVVGWVNRGSHDSYMNNVYISSSDESGLSADYGYIQQTNGNSGQKYGSNGQVAHGLHVWGNHNFNAVLLDNSNILDGFIYAEGSDGSAIFLKNSTSNKFAAFVGYCTNGVEFQETGGGSADGNDITCVVESNLTGSYFKLNDGVSNNILRQGTGYGTASTAVFDLAASYTGSKNTFIPWNAYVGTVFGGAGTLGILDFVDGSGITPPNVRKHKRMKNTSGGTINLGDVVVFKAVANGEEVTTTTTAGDKFVFGMAAETITNNNYGYIFVEGKTVALKVDGTTDIAIGDYLSCFTTAKIAKKAGAGEMAFAIALEAYTTNDSNGVIDALLLTPRLI